MKCFDNVKQISNKECHTFASLTCGIQKIPQCKLAFLFKTAIETVYKVF